MSNITIRFDKKDYAALKEAAEKDNRSINKFVIHAVKKLVEEQSKNEVK